jgi:hypothetical protein
MFQLMETYCILSSDHLGLLCEEVQKAFVYGWKCQGGITVAVHANPMLPTTFYQAMIKEIKTDAPIAKSIQPQPQQQPQHYKGKR